MTVNTASDEGNTILTNISIEPKKEKNISIRKNMKPLIYIITLISILIGIAYKFKGEQLHEEDEVPEAIVSKITQKYINNGTDENIYQSLKRYQEALAINDYYGLGIKLGNNEKASLKDIANTEAKLNVTLPKELKEYYTHMNNGSGTSIHKFLDESLEVFPHKKIMGITDFIQYLIKDMDSFDAYKTHSSADILLTKTEKKLVKDNNNEFFIFAIYWRRDWNDMDMFFFDKEHNIYAFNYDQDESHVIYIRQMLKGEIKNTSTKTIK